MLSSLLSLGLGWMAGEAVAQQVYPSASPSQVSFGYPQRPASWQPQAGTNWYQPSSALPGTTPIGSGVRTLPAPVDGAGRYPQTVYVPPGAGRYSAPAPQSPVNRLPVAPYQSLPYRGLSPQWASPAGGQPQGFVVHYPPVTPVALPPTQRSMEPESTVLNPAGRMYAGAPHDGSTSYGPEHTVNDPGGYAGEDIVPHATGWSGPGGELWAKGSGADPGCGPAGCGPTYQMPAARWFGGVYAVFMSRDQEDNVWLSYDTGDLDSRVLNSHDASPSYAAGFETRIGHYFGNGMTGIEFVYWGVFPDSEEANVYSTDVWGDLDTVLHLDGVSYDPGSGLELANTAFFEAERHRLLKEFSLHNFELNLIGTNFVQPCGCPQLNLSWNAGIRYVNFDDRFMYSADPWDNVFTGDPDELHYEINAGNDLLGFQLGGRADLCFTPAFVGFVGTKFGIYGNHATQHSRLYNSTGAAEVTDGSSPYVGSTIDVESNKTNVAFIGEVRTGLEYQFSPCWSATVGYRAVALTGVALSTDQIPGDYIGALDSLRTVNTNGSLIAHGGFVGLEFCR